jgi:serine/threonine-protein kinase
MAEVAAWRPATNAPAPATPAPAQGWSAGGSPQKNAKSGRKLAIAAALAVVFLVIMAGAGFYLAPNMFTGSDDNTAARPPELNPDAGGDARRAEDARLAAAEKLANQRRAEQETKRRAEEAERIATANAKNALNTLSPIDRPPSDPKERISRFVNAYDGGDCFFVAPVAVAEGKTTLEGYGVSTTPFEVLDYEFKRTNGFEATVGYHAVTQQQCAAITFVSRFRNQQGRPPRLDVSAGNLRSDGYVTGSISDFGNRNLELLMVDHEGIVQSLTKLLRGAGDIKTFTINIKRSDAGPPKLQLLMALVSAKPLDALKPAQSGTGEIGTAAQVFATAFNETQQSGQSLNISLKSFNLEK